MRNATACKRQGLDELLRRLDRNGFDLVAVGRQLMVAPDWMGESVKAAPKS